MRRNGEWEFEVIPMPREDEKGITYTVYCPTCGKKTGGRRTMKPFCWQHMPYVQELVKTKAFKQELILLHAKYPKQRAGRL